MCNRRPGSSDVACDTASKTVSGSLFASRFPAQKRHGSPSRPVADRAARWSPGAKGLVSSTTSKMGRSGRRMPAATNGCACARAVNATPAMGANPQRYHQRRQPRGHLVPWSCTRIGTSGRAAASVRIWRGSNSPSKWIISGARADTRSSSRRGRRRTAARLAAGETDRPVHERNSTERHRSPTRRPPRRPERSSLARPRGEPRRCGQSRANAGGTHRGAPIQVQSHHRDSGSIGARHARNRHTASRARQLGPHA